MKCVIFRELGGPDVLELIEVPEPTAGAGEVVIRALAMAVSAPDIIIRKGEYKWAPPLPANPGNELAGIIDTVGDRVTGFVPGQKVLMSSRELSVRGGCYTELISVPAAAVHALPEAVDIEQAVVVPSYVVAHAMFHGLGLSKTAESIFVTGGAGIIASAFTDLAKANGTAVIASVSSDAKAEFALSRGVDHVINYKTEKLVDQVMKFTNDRGVDASFDHAIGQTFIDCVHMLADFGTAVAYNVFSPMPDRDIFGELRDLSPKSPAIRVFNIHTYDHRQAELREITRDLIGMLGAGKINPTIGARFSLAEAVEAHRMFESGEILGKIILTPE
jgi:NADPH2:quinone reductase